jgi:hypothetical protein
MQSLEVELLKSISASPLDLPKYLVSPQINMNRKWFSDNLAVRVFSAIGQIATEGKRVSLLGIILSAHLSKDELEQVRPIWESPTAISEDDVKSLTENFKNEALTQDAAGAIREYEENTKLVPSEVRHNIDVLGTTLSVLSRDGVAYDPNPVSHYNDRGWELNGSWGRDMKGLDITTRGGMPRRGFWLYAAKSGTGKTSMGITTAAASVVRGEPVAIITNETPAGDYSRRLRDAITFMYGGNQFKSAEDIDRQIRQYSTVWEWKYAFEDVSQIIYWQQPKLTIVDSITRISPPTKTTNARMSDNALHEKKADGFLGLAGQFDTLIYAPGNGSREEQEKIVNKFEAVDSIMLFNSIAYFNACDLGTVSIRHPSKHMSQKMKCVKDRDGGKVGDIVQMSFSPEGHCYYGGEYASVLN